MFWEGRSQFRKVSFTPPYKQTLHFVYFELIRSFAFKFKFVGKYKEVFFNNWWFDGEKLKKENNLFRFQYILYKIHIDLKIFCDFFNAFATGIHLFD